MHKFKGAVETGSEKIRVSCQPPTVANMPHGFVRAARPLILLETISKRQACCALCITQLTVLACSIVFSAIAFLQSSKPLLLGVQPSCSNVNNCSIQWDSGNVNTSVGLSLPKGLVLRVSGDFIQHSSNNTNTSKQFIFASGSVVLEGKQPQPQPQPLANIATTTISVASDQWIVLANHSFHNNNAYCNGTDAGPESTTVYKECWVPTLTESQLSPTTLIQGIGMHVYRLQMDDLMLTTSSTPGSPAPGSPKVLAAVGHEIEYVLFVNPAYMKILDCVVRLICISSTILFYVYWLYSLCVPHESFTQWLPERQWITLLLPGLLLFQDPLATIIDVFGGVVSSSASALAGE